MSIAIEEQDFETLCHGYRLPDLIQKSLQSSSQEDQDFDIHEDLCNMHPEDALLCIALCLKAMELKYPDSHKLLSTLISTIDTIITNYGEAALERLHFEIPQSARVDIEFVAADLRDLARGLENIEPFLFEDDNDNLSNVLSALSIQAGAQAEIASYVLTSFKEQEQKNSEFKGSDVPFFRTFPVNDNRSSR